MFPALYLGGPCPAYIAEEGAQRPLEGARRHEGRPLSAAFERDQPPVRERVRQQTRRRQERVVLTRHHERRNG